MAIKRIPSNQIATGDCLIFPRIGPRIVQTITSVFSTSVSARFDDGVKRPLPADRLVSIDESKRETLYVRAGNLLRYDLATKRTSVIPGVLDSFFFPDIKEGFSVLKTAFCSSDSALMSELRAGNSFYTPRAVYWIPKHDLERRNFEFDADVFEAANWLVFGDGAQQIERDIAQYKRELPVAA